MIEKELYAIPEPNFSLHLTAVECTLTNSVRGAGAFGFSRYKQWSLQPAVARYLARCDGKTTHDEIAATALGNSPGASGSFAGMLGPILAAQAVCALKETGVLRYEPDPSPSLSPLRITGAFDSFAPLHISFEITDRCNFRCRHCYVSASPRSVPHKDGAAIIAALDQLAANGVRVVELTGGECTIHPQFKKILHHASAIFDLVAVMSNGYLLGKRPALAAFVGSHPNVAVQISIDGLREFHDQFRSMRGSFDAACAAVRSLKNCGTIVRIAMNVTQGNLDQVLGVYQLAKELGADALGVAPVTSFGRGVDVAGCHEMEHHVMHRLNEILAPHFDDPLFDALKRERTEAQTHGEINCGTGWRSFSLNSDGTVRSCLFMADSKRFGNIDCQPYGEIFRQQEMRWFHDAPAPGGVECCGPQPDGSDGCKYRHTCTGCFAKAFRVSESDYPRCPWRAKYFPGMSLTVSKDEHFIPGSRLAAAGVGTVTQRRSL